MVLHHVAQRAGRVVVGDAVLQADRLGHGDLHMVDMRRVPQRLVERVGEAQRHQVLHRLLAEIVVDAEDLVLAEDAADLVVQRLRRGEAAPDRLFDHDARVRRDQLMLLQLRGDVAEQRRRHRQIKGADRLAVADRLLQRVEARRLRSRRPARSSAG